MTILNPLKSPAEIRTLTQNACGKPSFQLLQSAQEKFPNAKIVLTGYFPILSQASDAKYTIPLGGTFGVLGVMTATSTVLPVLDPLTGAVSASIGLPIAVNAMTGNALTFNVESSRSLAKAASDLNTKFPGTAAFACVPFRAENAFGAPQTWLWPIPTDATPKDDVYADRGAKCRSIPEVRSNALEFNKCLAASMGHPNPAGATAYSQAITRQLAVFLPAWKEQFATLRTAQTNSKVLIDKRLLLK